MANRNVTAIVVGQLVATDSRPPVTATKEFPAGESTPYGERRSNCLLFIDIAP
jgi:hypothetical protein